uniref:Uncharacterized protein n=1 Tax=Kwoniella pini CBS 10737 TaxID=1296096 RepID=A0A1B9I565_9TREE|nr:uncharacterized protein I206_02720 [Kwoniella pini CBS 10737]OCF50665.1 hypothetical protein I206_02720 [Kwoniella pini CBS 10737]
MRICSRVLICSITAGTDPTRLIQHLQKIDPTLDQDYFTHLWTLLCAHSSIQVIITNEPILLPGGTTELGTAPLPEGWVLPQGIQANADLSTLYKEGFRGRQIAFMLAGQEFRSDKQAIQDKKEAQKKKAKKAKEATLKRNRDRADDNSDGEAKVDPSGAGTLRVLHVDDAQEDSPSDTIPKDHLRRLWDRWGARLRIRCTEDEIYYRLTGSHAKISKITATVFHVLQLAAMCREKGITAIDLGPLVGASQGSMHYFMKVLVELGLCAKVPAVLHASVTNLLVFHRFLEQNPNYCALIGKPLQSTDDANEDGADEPDSGDEDIDPSLDDGSKFVDWGFNFPTLTEADLMAGHAVKQRLLKMLDHPKLQNHLLRRKNLLPALGWQGQAVMRHRRAVKRHIDGLVIDGLVERLEVGEAKTSCIRLTKYNPELSHKAEIQDIGEAPLDAPDKEHDLELISSSPPYTPPLNPEILNVPLTVTFEHWIIDLVIRSEQNVEEDRRGMTINAIWQNTNYMYKRSIDFAILRSDNARIPEHLWPYSISSFMETVKKERRLRLFTTAEYQRIMLKEGQTLEGYPSMPRPPIAGDFGDTSFKYFYSSVAQLNKFLDDGKSLSGEMAPPKKIGRAINSSTAKFNSRQVTATPGASIVPEDADDNVAYESDQDNKGGKKEFRYADSSVQIRGRPRKYIHVVEEDGKTNRRIIGTIFSREDLPQVLIYIKSLNLLVTAPTGYSGLGPPPAPSQEAIQEGHPPQYYYQFPAKVAAAFSGLPGRKAKAKLDNKAKADADNSVVAEGDEGGREDQTKGKKGKGKKRNINSGSASEATVTPIPSRKSKRQKKDVKYDDAIDMIEIPNTSTPVRESGSNILVEEARSDAVNHQSHAAVVEPVELSILGPETSKSKGSLDSTSDAAMVLDTPNHQGSSAPPDVDRVPVLAALTTPEQPKRSSRKAPKGNGNQDTEAEQGTAAKSKSTNQSRKKKAANKTDTAAQPTQSVLPNNGTQNKNPTRSNAGSRFFPIDIPDESFDVTMEQGIGTVLAELSQSGVRPLPRPTAQAIAIASSGGTPHPMSPTTTNSMPASSTAARLASSTNATGATSKKRKPTPPAGDETPTKHPRSSKGKAIALAEPPQETAQAVEDDRRISLFKLPEEPMKETPFELPVDIVSAAKLPTQDVVTEKSAEPDSDLGAHPKLQETASEQPSAFENPIIDPALSEQPHEITADTVRTDQSSLMPPPNLEPQVRFGPHSVNRLSTPTSRSETPLREMSAGPSTPAQPSSIDSGTPYSGASGRTRNHKLLHAPKGTPNGGRIDLGSIRRANELVQVLQDNGGAMMDTRLLHEHRAWAFKYAGTDHPNAPATGYGMDRLVVKKTINTLMGEGRVKETIVSVPTPTGRWVKTSVLYLADLPHEQLQTYIRQMSTSIAQSMTPNAKKMSTPQHASLPNTPFTELPRVGPKNGGKLVFDATPTKPGSSRTRPFSERRTALLKELKVVGQLLGWKTSRSVRVQVLHRAMIKALSRKDCGSVASSSPRIFAFPLLCEEITAEEWYACCLVLSYNEDIEHWLRDPQNRATRLKDVPRPFRPVGGFGGSATKAKMNTLLQILVALKIISPVVPVAKEEAEFFADDSQENGFKLEESTISSTYYVLHDMVPIYHIASVPPPLLGLLPAITEADIDTLWAHIKRCSLELRIDVIGKIGEQTKPGLPISANISDILDISTDYMNLLQRPKRWRTEMNLHPIQKAALDDVFDRKTGQSCINNQTELEAFAYENALPLPFLEKEITRRAEVARFNAARVSERLKEHASIAQKRQARVQQNIRQKLIERQEKARQAWLDRIKLSGERKNVGYTDQLVEFVSRQTIQGGSLKMPDVSDNLVDYWVMIWEQVKDLSPEQRESELEERRRIQANRIRLTISKFVPRSRKNRTSTRKPKVKVPKTGFQRRIRSKRKWTVEDDEMIFDSEAIIRARSRSNGHKGRQAVHDQIFPDMAPTTLRNRLHKILTQPGKKAYFDRVEDAWYNLWSKIKGTDELKDDHPDDSVNFDLKDHVKVLREKIDKKSLRLLALSTPIEDQIQAPDLPSNSYEIAETYDWIYIQTEIHSFDLAADSIAAEEVRINSIGSISLLEDTASSVEHGQIDSRQMGLLQASMRILVRSPDENYDALRGQKLLQPWSDGQHDIAINDMLERNILRQLPTPSRDNERQYGYTQGWYALNEGYLPPNVSHTAQNLPAKLESEDGVEWPLIGEPGELANLMNMVSNHEVNDDAYEFPIQAKRAIVPSPRSPVSFPEHTINKPLFKWSEVIQIENQAEVRYVQDKVVQKVTESGANGIPKADLLDSVKCSTDMLEQSLAALAVEEDQRVFWAGYDTARLVSVKHWNEWCMRLQPMSGEERMIAPRRWYDLYGKFDEEDFEQAMEATKSLIITRPGITLRSVKERFSTILDRLELVDVLEFLIKSSKIEAKWSANQQARILPPIESIGLEEERDIALFPVIDRIW